MPITDLIKNKTSGIDSVIAKKTAEIENKVLPDGVVKMPSDTKQGETTKKNDSAGGKLKRGAVIGKTGANLTVIVYSNGTPIDPKLKWRSLNGKESNEETLGTQITKGVANTSKTYATDQVVIGGNADGTYDMDDDNNYIWDPSMAYNPVAGGATDAEKQAAAAADPEGTAAIIAKGMNAIDYHLSFNETLTKRAATEIIAIHHTGGNAGEDLDAPTIHKMHIEDNGWAGIGYHYVIRKNGQVELGRPGWAVGAHVELHNANSVGIHFCGNFEYDIPTEAQIASGKKLIALLCDTYGIARDRQHIKGHREFSTHESNECPGANLFAILNDFVPPEPVRTVPQGTSPSGSVETAVQWAINTANDDSITYAWGGKGPSQYDCSGFVSAAFNHAGIINGYVMADQGMVNAFTAVGFRWITDIDFNTSAQLQRGDILLRMDHHCEIYIGNDQKVGAHTDDYPVADQVSVEPYRNSNWTGILRYTK